MPDNFFDVVDISTINMDLIVTQLPGAPTWSSIENTTQGKYISAFLASEDILKAEGINTAMRLAHFLGQGLIESNFFRATEENLNYSAVALRATWPGSRPMNSQKSMPASQKRSPTLSTPTVWRMVMKPLAMAGDIVAAA